jgi:N-acetyl-anhydromuramyl-L-alanine amidase AmpD
MKSNSYNSGFWHTGFSSYLHMPPALFIAALILMSSIDTATAFTQAERRSFQQSIVDKQNQLNRKFRKINRKKTQYIIVHTAEGGLTSTLRTVLKGKSLRGRWLSRGGHTNYVIARNGRAYRILNRKYRADHAGLSMWNGEKDLSSISIGIELVGYHYTNITDKQYRSLALLLEILMDIYDLNDMAVLTHSQIAYGKPNRWIRKPHRGRKRCAKNFDRSKAALGTGWTFDPDVAAGRLSADPALASIYYDRRRSEPAAVGSNVITSSNTAWTIAGEEYDSPATLYKLPNGKIIPGDQIEERVGWKKIPENTIVLLNQEAADDKGQRLVKNISNGATAWDYAGFDYNKKSTFYFFPAGGVKNGKEISDWDELPSQTRMIVGYSGPYKVTGKRSAGIIAGEKYNHNDTLYYFPNKKIVSGDTIKDFKHLPEGVLVFLPSKG